MNKLILLNIVFCFFLFSCKKINDNTNPLLGNSGDKMSGRISSVTNNMQTKYGTFSSSASIQGIFKDELKINGFQIDDYGVKKSPSGMFISTTSADSTFEKKFETFYGNPLKLTLNNVNLSNLPYNPYANVVTIDKNIEKWEISKNNGLKLTWAVKNLKSIQSITRATNTAPFSLQPLDIIQQVPGAVTVVALVPGDLLHSTGKSMYWVVGPDVTSFTIDPSFLSGFSLGETIDISIGSGTNMVFYLNGNPIDILSLNTTYLPGFSVIN
jgi:hypothetical protein